MGEIIQTYWVRTTAGEKPRRLRFLFDSGSVRTFAKLSAVSGMREVLPLRAPKPFGGLGNGRFLATHLVDLEVRLYGQWCHQEAFVVPDDVFEERYDVLAGDNFMQSYNVKLDLRRRRAIPSRVSVDLSQRIRRTRSDKAI